ncbi:hypothetical protein [Nakamurella deserti]|uniref:hypothetical protein n=1 Tax=Nakamurella deserti TaxID=2164074 RepID=UPI00130083D0|nr:hypothetical protein [Nakamurella deserti]
MTHDTTGENQLDQFGLGPEDEAHDDAGKPRKGEPAVEGEDSSVNTFGMGPEDKERHHS